MVLFVVVCAVVLFIRCVPNLTFQGSERDTPRVAHPIRGSSRPYFCNKSTSCAAREAWKAGKAGMMFTDSPQAAELFLAWQLPTV